MTTVDKLFDIFSGSKLDFDKQEQDENGLLFVSRNSNNNGVVGRVVVDEKVKVFKKGDITVPLGGSYLLSCFVQAEDFVTAQNVAVLRPKNSMTDAEKWFYCYALSANRFKFVAFGREVNKYLKSMKIPSLDEIPNWVYTTKAEPLKTDIKATNIYLETNKWKKFKYKELFDVKKGFYNKKPEHSIEGNIPFLGATEKNNGVTEYYSLEDIEMSSKTGKGKNAPIEKKVFPANAVCVTNNGSVGYAFYQPNEFTCSHDVNPLYLLDGEFNKYTGLFVAAVIEKDRYRWTYGRKWRPERMVDSEIALPVTKDGKPDWLFMEEYIKSLPYSDKL